MSQKTDKNADLLDLQRVKIASPCSADWAAMSGDERKRFCDSCQLSVYNISEMTAPEASRLIRENEGDRLCLRFHRRADGTIITQDCPVGYAVRASRFLKACAAGLLSVLGLLPGCKADEVPDRGRQVPEAGTELPTKGHDEKPEGPGEMHELGEPVDTEPLQGSICVEEEIGDIDPESITAPEVQTNENEQHQERLGRVGVTPVDPEPEIGKIKLEGPRKN